MLIKSVLKNLTKLREEPEPLFVEQVKPAKYTSQKWKVADIPSDKVLLNAGVALLAPEVRSSNWTGLRAQSKGTLAYDQAQDVSIVEDLAGIELLITVRNRSTSNITIEPGWVLHGSNGKQEILLLGKKGFPPRSQQPIDLGPGESADIELVSAMKTPAEWRTFGSLTLDQMAYGWMLVIQQIPPDASLFQKDQ